MYFKRSALILIILLLPFAFFSQSFKKTFDEIDKAVDEGDFEKALSISTKALKSAESDKKVNTDDLLELKSYHAGALVANYRIEEGIKIFTELTAADVLKSAKPKTVVTILENYGFAMGFLELHAEAGALLKQAYDIAIGIEYDKKDMLGLMVGLAQTYHFAYNFTASETFFKDALAFCEKEKMTGDPDYPATIHRMASLYQDMEFQTKALETYELAENAFKKNKDTSSYDYAIFLENYGTMLTEVHQYEKALSVTFRSRDHIKRIRGENSEDYATVINNIGFVYSEMNKFTETEQFYIRGLELKKANPNTTIGSYLTSVNNIMVFSNNMGRLDEAVEYAADLEKGLLNPKFQDSLKRAIYAANLAMLFKDKKNYIKAENYFKECIKYYEKIYGPNSQNIATPILGLIEIYQAKEDYEKVNVYQQKLLGIYNSIAQNASSEKTIDIISLTQNMINMAVSLHRLEQYKEAEQAIDKAFETYNESKYKDREVLEYLHLNKAIISGDLNKFEESMDHYSKYLEIKYAQIDQNFAYMTELEKMYFLDKFEESVKSYFTNIMNFIDKHPELTKVLVNFRLQTKGLLLNNVTKIKQQINELNDRSLKEKFEQLTLKRETISKLMNLNTDEYPSALSEMETMKKEADQLEKEISLKVSSVGKMSEQKIFWKNIQKSLQPDEAAIEIIQSKMYYTDTIGTNYTYLIIKSTGDPLYVAFNRPSSWENEVLSLYRNSINSKKDNADLYRRLWKPINDKLDGIKNVYVSLDGIYTQINLNTLWNGETKKYLIEEKNIHYLNSLRELMDVKFKPSKKPQTVALVGNPNFDYDLSKLPQNKQEFGQDLAVRGAMGFVLPELPGTKTEVETIKSHLIKNNINVTLLSEEKANEAEVKKIKNPDVLHLATHGFFLEDYSEEALSSLTKTEQSYYKNPMMLSGIFFSGSNKTYSINTSSVNQLKEFEDGMLTAYEAMNLHLDKTELVILSACQTGLGKVKNGEGVFGLQRAFKLAGAKSIIMSYWPVSDDATMELMTNFYNSWTATGDVYTAFKVAQMAVKQKYPEPYYWGAFVLNGR